VAIAPATIKSPHAIATGTAQAVIGGDSEPELPPLPPPPRPLAGAGKARAKGRGAMRGSVGSLRGSTTYRGEGWQCVRGRLRGTEVEGIEEGLEKIFQTKSGMFTTNECLGRLKKKCVQDGIVLKKPTPQRVG
jgi:hypothetical protein